MLALMAFASLWFAFVSFAFGFLHFCLSIFIYIKNLPEGRLGLLLFSFTFPFQ